MQAELTQLFSFLSYKARGLVAEQPDASVDTITNQLLDTLHHYYSQSQRSSSFKPPFFRYLVTLSKCLASQAPPSSRTLSSYNIPISLVSPITDTLSNSITTFAPSSPHLITDTFDDPVPLTLSQILSPSLLHFPEESSIAPTLDSLKKACLSRSSSNALTALHHLSYFSYFELASSPFCSKAISTLQLTLTTFLSSLPDCPSYAASRLFLGITLASHPLFLAEYTSLYAQHCSVIHAKLISNSRTPSLLKSLTFRIGHLHRLLLEIPLRWHSFNEKSCCSLFDSVFSLIKPLKESHSSRESLHHLALLLCSLESATGGWLIHWVCGSNFVVSNTNMICRTHLFRSLFSKKVVQSATKILSTTRYFEWFSKNAIKTVEFSVVIVGLVFKFCPNYVLAGNRNEYFQTLFNCLGYDKLSEFTANLMIKLTDVSEKYLIDDIDFNSLSLQPITYFKLILYQLTNMKHSSNSFCNLLHLLVSFISNSNFDIISTCLSYLSCYPSIFIQSMTIFNRVQPRVQHLVSFMDFKSQGVVSLLSRNPVVVHLCRISLLNPRSICLFSQAINYGVFSLFLDHFKLTSFETFWQCFSTIDFNSITSFFFLLSYLTLFPDNYSVFVEQLINDSNELLIFSLNLILNLTNNTSICFESSISKLYSLYFQNDCYEHHYFSQYESNVLNFKESDKFRYRVHSCLPSFSSVSFLYGFCFYVLFKVSPSVTSKLLENNILLLICWLISIKSQNNYSNCELFFLVLKHLKLTCPFVCEINVDDRSLNTWYKEFNCF
ncbi:hypothetical protein P9112_008609 [Eukaryota sp. TZLM1-RC]